jgi:radical SAM family uncharacterized protein
MRSGSGSGLWERIEPLLDRVERPVRYVDGEWNAVRDDASYRVALVYPDTYELGMANQALSILYARLGSLPEVVAERCFVPWKDMADLLRQEGIPLFTLETGTPLAGCDLVGITLPYELTYTNILEVLDLAGIPLYAAARGEEDPLIVGGGPCAFNPEPVADFFDAILVGEGEEAVVDIVEAHRAARAAGVSRAETLRALAAVPGVYVPSLYRVKTLDDGSVGGMQPLGDAPRTVVKRVVADLDAVPSVTCPVVPYMDVVHDRATIEILRGCTRGCRFCQAGMVYRPVRERDADTIVRDVMTSLACTGYEEVSLTSLSSTDHSLIEEVARRLARRLEGRGVTISLPSSRVDAFSVGLSRLIATGRKGGLTFAPEAATQRLRDVINKNVSEADLLDTVGLVCEAGWRRVKLYFMIGLPTETDDDVREIGRVVSRVLEAARQATPREQRGSLRVNVSVATFVPKAHTPFQWELQLTPEEVLRRQAILRETMPRSGVSLSWHESETSYLEGVMARGGRDLARVIELAWLDGARFAAWTEEFDLATWVRAFEGAGVDTQAIVSTVRAPGEPLPWSHISSGVTEEFLASEREAALEGRTTPDCSFEACSSCGVCSGLGVEVRVQGVRRG